MAMEATATVERAGSGATCQTDPAPDMAASAQQEAVALLEAVCQTGDAASLEALRELVKQDEAAQLTASKVRTRFAFAQVRAVQCRQAASSICPLGPPVALYTLAQ